MKKNFPTILLLCFFLLNTSPISIYSGEECSASYMWQEHGDYEIKVKVKDIYALESPWSNPIRINMTWSNNQLLKFIIQFIETFILKKV